MGGGEESSTAGIFVKIRDPATPGGTAHQNAT